MEEDTQEAEYPSTGFIEEEQEEGYFISDDSEQEEERFLSEEEQEAIEEEDNAQIEDAPIDVPNKHFVHEEQGEHETVTQQESYEAEDTQEFSVPIRDKETSAFFKKMIQEEHPIVEHIVYFNLRKAKEIHSSHYVGIGEVLFKRDFLPTILASRRASLYYTEHLDILVGSAKPKGIWFTDFSEYQTRFALLPGSILEELSVFLGMMIFHARVRKIIEQEGVTGLRHVFGKRAADFGVRRVPLFLHDVDSLYNIFKLPHHWDIEDLVRESGRYGLGLCVSTLPVILQKSIMLKLPRGFLSSDEYDPHAVGPEEFSTVQRRVLSNKLFPVLRKILTLEVAPEWTPFFF